MISIIIPTYNRSHLIEETLRSIGNQTYLNWECILVDDGSSQETIKHIEQLIETKKRFYLYKRPSHLQKGPSACRNYGFTLAKGNYIQFFDSDDIMHPDHLKLKIEAFGNNDLVVCKLKEFSNDFKGFQYYKPSKDIIKPRDNFEAFVTGEFPMMMVAPLWRKNVLQKYMPILEDLHILEDHELYARALFCPKKIAIVNRDLIFYRVGSLSSTNSFYNNVDYGLKSYFKAKKNVLKLSKSPKIKLAILKMTLGFFRQALAERNINAANSCLNFIKKNQLCYNLELSLKFYRISLFYAIFKIFKKGDTKFKPLFKL